MDSQPSPEKARKVLKAKVIRRSNTDIDAPKTRKRVTKRRSRNSEEAADRQAHFRSKAPKKRSNDTMMTVAKGAGSIGLFLVIVLLKVGVKVGARAARYSGRSGSSYSSSGSSSGSSNRGSYRRPSNYKPPERLKQPRELSVNEWGQELLSGDQRRARHALRTLEQLKAYDQSIIILKFIQSADSFGRREAIELLRRFGPKASDIVPELIKAIDSDPKKHHDFFKLLAAVDPKLKQSLPTFKKYYNGPMHHQLKYMLQSAKVDLYPFLVENLKSTDTSTVDRALRDLMNSPATLPDEATDLIVPHLKNQRTQWSARRVLKRCSSKSLEKHWPSFKQAILNASKDWHAGDFGKDMAIRIGSPVVPDLLKILQNTQGQGQRFAIEALRDMGPAAKSAIPDLKKRMRSKNSQLAQTARDAISFADPNELNAVFQFIKKTKNSDLRSYWVDRLINSKHLKDHRDKTLPMLVTIAKQGDYYMARDVAHVCQNQRQNKLLNAAQAKALHDAMADCQRKFKRQDGSYGSFKRACEALTKLSTKDS